MTPEHDAGGGDLRAGPPTDAPAGEEPPIEAAALPEPPHGMTLRELADQRWAVLVLLFCVMGVLGLPILWWSRGFGLVSKLVLSVLVTLYTAGLVWIAWRSVLSAYETFQQYY